jgi:hypothetical protein
VECGKYSLNLSKASITIYYSLPWGLNTFDQSQARILLPGKMHAKFYYLITKEINEIRILKALKEKRQGSKALLEEVL